MDRRDFIKSASILSLGALAGCGNSKEAAPAAAAAAATGDKQLGLQIYTLGDELYNGDLAVNRRRLLLSVSRIWSWQVMIQLTARSTVLN